MKREGRQHGMVRSYEMKQSPWDPRPSSRSINKFDSPPTAGHFIKVQTKPTNHSKFTGKCGKVRCTECHMHPCSKSKEKTKGAQKIKSQDVVSNHRLMTWRVADGRHGFSLNGLSATGMLHHLASESRREEDDSDQEDDEDDQNVIVGVQEITVEEDDKIVDDDGNLSFCDVGFVIDQVIEGEDDEGWCLVGEL